MNVDMYTRISLYLYKEKNLGWVLKHEHDFFKKTMRLNKNMPRSGCKAGKIQNTGNNLLERST